MVEGETYEEMLLSSGDRALLGSRNGSWLGVSLGLMDRSPLGYLDYS